MGKFKLSNKSNGKSVKHNLGRKKDNKFDPRIIRKDLGDGILGEANDDGTIYVDNSVPDHMVNYVAVHEMQHRTDMKIGKSTYDDNYVYYKGEAWKRENGKIINPYTGKSHVEGDGELPWEKDKI